MHSETKEVRSTEFIEVKVKRGLEDSLQILLFGEEMSDCRLLLNLLGAENV